MDEVDHEARSTYATEFSQHTCAQGVVLLAGMDYLLQRFFVVRLVRAAFARLFLASMSLRFVFVLLFLAFAAQAVPPPGTPAASPGPAGPDAAVNAIKT